jgi:hypothetical protein
MAFVKDASIEDPFCRQSVCQFIADQYQRGFKFNTIRSRVVAISATVSDTVPGSPSLILDPLIQALLKGVKARQPSAPPVPYMWDLQAVLRRLAAWSPEGLHELSSKTALIVALSTMWRPRSDLARISFVDSIISATSAYLVALAPKEGDWKTILLEAYVEATVCPVAILNSYITATAALRPRRSNALFIRPSAPHSDASADTVRNWVRDGLTKCGVDMSSFRVHSTRSVSSSSAARIGCPLADILAAANWKNASCFRQFYCRPLVATAPPTGEDKLASLGAAEAAPKRISSIFEKDPYNLLLYI